MGGHAWTSICSRRCRTVRSVCGLFRRCFMVRRGRACMADPALHLTDLQPCTRLILRGRAAAIEAATAPLGFALPLLPCRAVTVRKRSALWLGPDEWLILASPSDPVAAALAQAMQGH